MPTESSKMYRIMNICPNLLSINLDTRTAAGLPDSRHIPPRYTIELTGAQIASYEIQKLLKAKFLIDVTAVEQRRLAREKELSGEKK